MAGNKQKTIDLATKIEIINAAETAMDKKSEIARHYSFPRCTSSMILENKEKFTCLLPQRKLKPEVNHCRSSTYANVEETLLIWFRPGV